MATFKTHYDNLKVSPSASDSEIRAAYRKLAQKFRPDESDGKPAEANRIMKILNDAKATLLEPTMRRAYDLRNLERDKEEHAEEQQQRAQQMAELERAKEQKWRAHQTELQRRARAATQQSAQTTANEIPSEIPPQPHSLNNRKNGKRNSYFFLAVVAGTGFFIMGPWGAIGGAALFLFRRPLTAALTKIVPAAAVIAALAFAVFLMSGQAGNVQPPPTLATAVQAVAQASNPLLEVKPTEGSNLDRSPAQIRYCLSEDIRMEAIKGSLDSYSQFEIDRFNASVIDYNNICSRYRYKRAAFEIVTNDVAGRRSELVSEGLARLSARRRLAPVALPRAVPAYDSAQRL